MAEVEFIDNQVVIRIPKAVLVMTKQEFMRLYGEGKRIGGVNRTLNDRGRLHDEGDRNGDLAASKAQLDDNPRLDNFSTVP
jgi:hypothetical protein